MMVADAPADGELIGRNYTKAQRMPLVVGMTPGGKARLPGGPYTLTQLGVMVALFVPLLLTRSFWSTGGWFDLVVLIVIPYGAAWALRYLHVDGRNPAAAAASALLFLLTPRRGRLHGRALTRPRPTAVSLRVNLGGAGPRPATAPARLPVAERPATGSPARPAPGPRHPAIPSPGALPATATAAADGPVASPLQLLLQQHSPTDPSHASR
ncbi:hypothetical protein G5C51_04605 [Streptomyces sp. A7024]|uniref:Uncharacterized protein n=1 Tax=Streptomyces coryli TaxID=1128680 RepID=A0A6G4TT39_9ACTN|nr:hypothetical protein [Streptomyces coryli]NGN63189.1 hypothetical protein [Streptomyces coryli]